MWNQVYYLDLCTYHKYLLKANSQMKVNSDRSDIDILCTPLTGLHEHSSHQKEKAIISETENNWDNAQFCIEPGLFILMLYVMHSSGSWQRWPSTDTIQPLVSWVWYKGKLVPAVPKDTMFKHPCDSSVNGKPRQGKAFQCLVHDCHIVKTMCKVKCSSFKPTPRYLWLSSGWSKKLLAEERCFDNYVLSLNNSVRMNLMAWGGSRCSWLQMSLLVQLVCH